MPIPFRPIARLLTRTLHPSTHVDLGTLDTYIPSLGLENGGVLVTHNHYSAPDHPGFWSAIHVSAAFPFEIHWVVASAWTGPGWFPKLTRWLFPRGARLLGFTSMPPMPPDPKEAEQRALAVRQLLEYAHRTPHPVIGLSPEGGDTPDGVLGELPPGVGRFVSLISHYCPRIIPAGVWKEEGVVYVKFGVPYRLDVAGGISADERDRLAGEVVMRKIAGLVPERLRGRYG